jgi:aminopeptidase N
MEAMATEAVRVIDYFEDYFGIRLPLPIMQIVIVPYFAWAGMENFGLVILSSLQTPDELLVHELVHQWAGDITAVKVWNDVWINEGFATLFPWYYFDVTDPEFLSLSTECHLSRLLRFDQNATEPVRLVSYKNAQENFNQIRSYLKAGLIQKMMRNYLGPENFRAAVSTYFREFYMESAGLDELVSVYSRYKDSNLLYGWITQPGFPVIILEDDGRICQCPANQPLEKDERNWIVPIDVRYGVGNDRAVDVKLVIGIEGMQFGEVADWVCLNFSLETPCRVWHKGRLHRGILNAIQQGKIPKSVSNRIRNDLVSLVDLKAISKSMLDEFPVAK